MSTLTVETCGICACGCRMVQQRTWRKATPAQRSEWLADGLNILQAHGMCRVCYLRAYRRGEIAPRGQATTPTRASHPCARCGITTTAELCRDCEEVTAC